MKKKILFIIGSPNQTTQMYQIYLQLKEEFDCYFTQFFPGDWMMDAAVALKTMETTILSGHFRQKGEQFVAAHGLKYDYRGSQLGNTYDLIFMCIDISYPPIARRTKTIWVQEGMIDPITPWAKWVKRLRLPAYFAVRTSLNGSMNRADIYCAASEGYKEYFANMGTERDRIVVTGMINFDNASQYLYNDFPYHDYVLVCTSDIRETFRDEDRVSFIKHCVDIANGRPLIFKLHPNEQLERAHREIKENTPDGTLVFQEGDTNHMIANCQELITQYSTVVYIGMALGKPVHSYFDRDFLDKMMPMQNQGRSAYYIAEIARRYIYYSGHGKEFLATHNQFIKEMINETVPTP
ncbi:MAG: hypothetical protein LC101_09140 [Flavobacteriales bacterium]|nr:hypothetical protein [Flavobacteriales bacterium]